MGLRRKAGRGLLTVGAFGMIISITTVAAVYINSHQFYPDEFRKSQETALIQKFQKSEDPILEEIFKAQNFEIKYDAKTHTFGDSVSASSALEKVCNTAEFAPQPVCQEYSQIPAKVAAQAQIHSKYLQSSTTLLKWANGTFIASFALSAFSAISLLHYKPKEILPAP